MQTTHGVSNGMPGGGNLDSASNFTFRLTIIALFVPPTFVRTIPTGRRHDLGQSQAYVVEDSLLSSQNMWFLRHQTTDQRFLSVPVGLVKDDWNVVPIDSETGFAI